MSNEYNFDLGDINKHVNHLVRSLGDLKGKKVLDCPCGDGRTSYVFRQQGADVTSADLFPEFFKLDGKCEPVDFADGLPFADESFDYVICQEGIEHLSDQVFVLHELARVLKKEGTLIITTPNISHLRAKVSFLLTESEYFKRSPPNELDSVWFSEKNESRLYFGHVFLINAQKLRTLALFCGLEINRFHKTDLGTTSILLFPFLYPFILMFNLMPILFYSRKLKHVEPGLRYSVMREQFRINCSPRLLLNKHLLVTLKKVRSQSAAQAYLKSLTRGKDH